MNKILALNNTYGVDMPLNKSNHQFLLSVILTSILYSSFPIFKLLVKIIITINYFHLNIKYKLLK